MDENPPAFPSEQHECQDGAWNQTYQSGMSLRDYFAGQALAGIVAHDSVDFAPLNPGSANAFARDAYAIADAMMLARKDGAA